MHRFKSNARWLICFPILVLLILVSQLSRGDDASKDLERFELFADCRPMNLVVEHLSDDAKEIGLTREQITNAAESRLRSARIYNGSSRAQEYLYVQVSVAGNGYGTSVRYGKKLFDSSSGRSGYATTWTDSATGTHGGNRNYILSFASEGLDKFIVEYLRVNEDACD